MAASGKRSWTTRRSRPSWFVNRCLRQSRRRRSCRPRSPAPRALAAQPLALSGRKGSSPADGSLQAQNLLPWRPVYASGVHGRVKRIEPGASSPLSDSSNPSASDASAGAPQFAQPAVPAEPCARATAPEWAPDKGRPSPNGGLSAGRNATAPGLPSRSRRTRHCWRWAAARAPRGLLPRESPCCAAPRTPSRARRARAD
jgi:hypothetical protein